MIVLINMIRITIITFIILTLTFLAAHYIHEIGFKLERDKQMLLKEQILIYEVEPIVWI